MTLAFGVASSRNMAPMILKPHTSDFVAQGVFFSKNDLHIVLKPHTSDNVAAGVFVFQKNGSIFLEGPYV